MITATSSLAPERRARRAALLNYFSLFSTLICCALPSVFLLLGMGTAVASLLTDAPWLVTWFNNAKGYGFFSGDNGKDVFVRYSSIQVDGYKTLKEGDPVEYDVVQGEKGPQADRVTLVKKDPASHN